MDTAVTYELANLGKYTIYLETPDIQNISSKSYFVNPLVTMVIDYLGKPVVDMNKYKVIVYAICKNEEKYVDKWYDSIKEADKIFVLDTGSTDNTIRKLKRKRQSSSKRRK